MPEPLPVPKPMWQREREAIVEALRYTRGDINGASYFLQIGRCTVYRKIKSYEIKPVEWCAVGQAQAGGAR